MSGIFPSVKGAKPISSTASDSEQALRCARKYANKYVNENTLTYKDAELLATKKCSYRFFQRVVEEMKTEKNKRNSVALPVVRASRQQEQPQTPRDRMLSLVEQAGKNSDKAHVELGPLVSNLATLKELQELIKTNPDLKEECTLNINSSSSFYRSISKSSSSASSKAGGRPQLLDNVAKEQMHRQIMRLSNEGCGFPGKEDFKKFVIGFVRATMSRDASPVQANLAYLKEIKFSESTLCSLRNEFVPEKLQKADRQNRERFLARVKILKHFVNAMVVYSSQQGITGKLWKSVLDEQTTIEENITAVAPCLQMNDDDTSVDLDPSFEERQPVLVAKGTAKRFRDTQTGAAYVKPEDFKESVAQAYVQELQFQMNSLSMEDEEARRLTSSTSSDVFNLEKQVQMETSSKNKICSPLPDTHSADTFVHRGAKIGINTNYKGVISFIVTIASSHVTDVHYFELSKTFGLVIKPYRAKKAGSGSDSGSGSSSSSSSSSGSSSSSSSSSITLEASRVSGSGSGNAEPFYLDGIHEEEIDENSEREQAYQKRKRFIYPAAERNRAEFKEEYITQILRNDPAIISPEVFELELAFPMCFSHDGCGPDLNGIMDTLGIDDPEELVDEDESRRRSRACAPPNVRDVKTSNSGTAQSGDNDRGKGHTNIKGHLKSEDLHLVQNRDEALIPVYMNFVQDTLVYLGFVPIEQRTYFKLLCNIEKIVYVSMSEKTMLSSYRLTGKVPFNFLYTLRNWACDAILALDPEDFQMMEKVAPYVLYIVNRTGTCHEDLAATFLDGFLRKVASRTLSDVALRELATEASRKKPMSQRTLSQTGATILTNSGFIQKRKESLSSKEDELVQKGRLTKQPELIDNIAYAVGLTMRDSSQKTRCKDKFQWRSQKDKQAKLILFEEVITGNWLEEVDLLNFKLTCKDAIQICSEKHTETFKFPAFFDRKQKKAAAVRKAATPTDATTTSVGVAAFRTDIVCAKCHKSRQLPSGIYFIDFDKPFQWTCAQAAKWSTKIICGK
jgi:uncharacterized protein YigA (DUF484 family)